MRQASAFIIEMARVISDDLRDSVAPDKLQFEVEVELEKQILSQTVQAIHEYSSNRSGYRAQTEEGMTAAKIARRKVMRYFGYCNEMWHAVGIVKGNLAAGEIGAEFEVHPS